MRPERPSRGARATGVATLFALVASVLAAIPLPLPLGSAGRPGPPGPVGRSGSIYGPSAIGGSPIGVLPRAVDRPTNASSGLRVASTLVLLNNTTLPGNQLPVNGEGPGAIAYDSGHGTLYVADEGSNSVSVLNATTFATMAAVPLPSSPRALAYDASLGEVFVAVGGEVDVINDTSQQRVADIKVGGTPSSLALDPGLGKLFVAGTGSGVSVVATASDRVIANLTTSFYSLSVVYDAGRGRVYLADFQDGSVAVLAPATDTFVSNVSVGLDPISLAYDPGDGKIFVAGYETYNLSVVNDTTDTVVARPAAPFAPYASLFFDRARNVVFDLCFLQDGTNPPVRVYAGTNDGLVGNVSMGGAPNGAAYDGALSEVVASQYSVDTLSVINDTSLTVNATVPVGLHPSAIAFDAATDELDVTLANLDAVDVLSARTGALRATIQVGAYPIGLVADPRLHELFVANQAASTVTVLSDLSRSVVATISLPPHSPTGIALDPALGVLYVPDAWSNVSVINVSSRSVVATVGVGYQPGGIAIDPARGEIFVANQGQGSGGSVSVISEATDHVVANVKVGMYPRAVAYDPQRGDVLVANSGGASDNVSVISDQNNTVVARIATPRNPSALTYDPSVSKVFVAEAGSAAVGAFSDVSGGLVDTAVGAAPSALAYDPSDHRVYATNSGQGTVSALELANFTVTLQATGLPAGTTWSASFDGVPATSSGPSLAFDVSNGTYPYEVDALPGIVPSPASGLVVVDGSEQTVPIAFQHAYTLTFAEVGLPAGANWSVRVDGRSNASGGPRIAFAVTNGTHAFEVTVIAGYPATPSSGVVTVAGADFTEAIVFAAFTYRVTFNETGLPTGTSWSIILNGSINSSSTTAIGFFEPNRTSLSFSVGAVPGYTANPPSGAVSVLGSAVSQTIDFSRGSSGAGALEVRAWANQTAVGGELSSCQKPNGSIVTTGDAWQVWSYTATAENGTPPYNFTWVFPGETVAYNGAHISINYTYPQTYPPSIKVTARDSAGESNSTTRILPVPAPPVAHYPQCPVGLGLTQPESYILLALVALGGVPVAAALLIWRRRRRGSISPR